MLRVVTASSQLEQLDQGEGITGDLRQVLADALNAVRCRQNI